MVVFFFVSKMLQQDAAGRSLQKKCSKFVNQL
jgi:hypothetical protein